VIEIAIVGIVVIVIGHHNARTDIGSLSVTATFAHTSASSLSTSKPEEGRRAEGLEEAL
jgi:hypothetical protein